MASKVDNLVQFLIKLPSWFDSEAISLNVKHCNTSTELDVLCKIEAARPKLVFDRVVLKGSTGRMRQTSSFKAVELFLQKSRKLTMINTFIDMSEIAYESQELSKLKGIKLIDSDFKPPKA